jgi:hypothetical protein
MALSMVIPFISSISIRSGYNTAVSARLRAGPSPPC